jgi:hypothetical protein
MHLHQRYVQTAPVETCLRRGENRAPQGVRDLNLSQAKRAPPVLIELSW